MPGAAAPLACPAPPLPNFGFRSDLNIAGCTYETVRVYDTFKPFFRAIFDITAVSNFHRPTALAINAVTA